MLDKAPAERLADELDLDGVFACLVWPETAPTLELAVVLRLARRVAAEIAERC